MTLSSEKSQALRIGHSASRTPSKTAALLLFLFLSACTAMFAELRAGAATEVITPDPGKYSPIYLAGFGQNRQATAVHDDLYARCLALQVDGPPVVMCGVDLIGLFFDDVEQIRSAARKKLGTEAHIVVAALHDHEGPDTMGLWGPATGASGINEDYNRFVVERASEAIVEAVRSLKPASVSLTRIAGGPLDDFIHDDRPPVVHDSGLVVLSATDNDGKRIGTLVNWANHPETLGSKNTRITADYAAFLYRRLEERLGGVAVFINGAVGGMQSPLDAQVMDPSTGEFAVEASFQKAEIIGRTAADLAAQSIEQQKPIRIDHIEYREKIISIPVTNAGFQMAAKADIFKGRKPMTPQGTSTPGGIIRMSDGAQPWLEIALVPGELYPELSVGGVQRYAGADYPDAPVEPAIKRMMTAPYRMLFGLADDEIGYIIPKAEWDERPPWLQNSAKEWYGEVNSVGPEAARRIAEAIQELLSAR